MMALLTAASVAMPHAVSCAASTATCGFPAPKWMPMRVTAAWMTPKTGLVMNMKSSIMALCAPSWTYNRTGRPQSDDRREHFIPRNSSYLADSRGK